MNTVLTNCNLFTAGRRVPDQDVVLADGYIVYVGAPASNQWDGRRVDLAGRWLAPGFIDLQVNGAGDELFQTNRTTSSLSTMADALRALGVTAFLPTLTATTSEETLEAAEAVGAYIAAGADGVMGLNLEGPFINPAKAGMADAAQCRPFDRGLVREVVRCVKPGKVYMTVAPEVVRGAVDELVRQGVIVSVGHTLASYEETVECVRRGATVVTHLFNAMTGLTGRDPGVVAAALDAANVYVSLIADGYHVHPASCRVAAGSLGVERLLLISDGMPPLAGTVREFSYGPHRVTEQDGRCATEEDVLAGTAVGLAHAARNLADWLEIDVARVVPAVTSVPARTLGLGRTHGEIRAGNVADLVIVDDALNVEHTIVGGDT
jgi:N-acetylglucosamine-6-phosphate deacetylase